MLDTEFMLPMKERKIQYFIFVARKLCWSMFSIFKVLKIKYL